MTEIKPYVALQRGRSSILSEKLIEEFAAETAKGRTRMDAAFLLGINPRTVENWITAGQQIAEGNLRHPRVPMHEEQRELCLNFYMAIWAARATPRAKALDVLLNKLDGDNPSLYAALEVLDRLGDGQYSRIQKSESHHVEERREYHIDVAELGNADEIAAILVATGVRADEIGFFEPGSDADALPALGSGETVYPLDAREETRGLSAAEQS